MTGEKAHRDDSARKDEAVERFDEESFVLDGLDEEIDAAFAVVEDEVLATSDESASASETTETETADVDAEVVAAADAEDLLFSVDGDAQPEAAETPFREQGGSDWGGVDLTPQDIGIADAPAQGDEFADGDSDVQEVDLESDESLGIVEEDTDSSALDTDDTNDDGVASADEGDSVGVGTSFHELRLSPAPEDETNSFGDGGFFADPVGNEEVGVAATADDSMLVDPDAEPVDEDWAAADEGAVDDGTGEGEYADADASAQDEYAEAEAEPDYSEHEEAFVDSAPIANTGAPVRRSRFWRGLAAAAVLVVLGGAGGVAWYKPEWIGIVPPETSVEVTRVARPDVDVTMRAPSLGVRRPGDTAGGEVTGAARVAADVTGWMRRAVDSMRGTAGGPGGGVDRTPKDPNAGGTGEPAARPDVEPHVDRIAVPVAKELGTVDVGGDLRIGGRYEAPADATPAGPARTFSEGVVAGGKAVAQLQNGNYFIGTVKSLDDATVTLKLEKGEITFGYAELTTLSALGSVEFEELQRADRGFVRLSNRNRLVGTIVRRASGDQIVLETQSSRVVIPRATIEEIGIVGTVPVQVREEEDSAWLRSMVDRMLDPNVTPTPTPPTTDPATPGNR